MKKATTSETGQDYFLALSRPKQQDLLSRCWWILSMFLEASYWAEFVVVILKRNFASDVTTASPASTTIT